VIEFCDSNESESESGATDSSYHDEENEAASVSSTLQKERPDTNDLHKTHLWMKDSKNTCAARIIMGTLTTIPALFYAIKEAFVKDNAKAEALIAEKGDVVAIIIMFWNLGPTEITDVESPFILDVSMAQERLTSLRLHLAWGFSEYREEMYGEQLLCIGTVVFENDLKKEYQSG